MWHNNATPVPLPVQLGDRVLVRDRPWRVERVTDLPGSHVALQVAALDGQNPARLSVVSPPEEFALLPSEAPSFGTSQIDSFHAWLRAHQIIDATRVRETGVLSGARFGRVLLEAYQLAPALRLLAKPRPSLLVADDVGLGKTIEAGLALLELMARGRARRVLVVVPAGLVEQWRDELLDKFGLAFTLVENAAGLNRAQTDLPAGISPWDGLPFVITSIDFLKKETVRQRALRKRWDLVIVDEAHALAESGTPQNPYRTLRTRLGTALRDGTRGLLLLTATPHNGYPHSYRSLLELVEPTLATFHGDPAAVQRRIESARIRRMKAQIYRIGADGGKEPVFPKRFVCGIPVSGLDPHERELLTKVAAYCSKTAEAAAEDERDLISFAMQIVKKRALSSRQALTTTIERRLDALRNEQHRTEPPDRGELRDLQVGLPLSDAAAERTADRILRSAIPKEERRRKSEVKALNAIRKLLKQLPARDPKIEALTTEIRSVLADAPGEKFIVFTEYLDTLDAVARRFDSDPDLRERYVILKGGLSRKQRRARQDEFAKPDIRVLLATDAASEGLNLQRHCRRIIHVELPWNPNRLEQRNGRVDRYGQTRNPEIRYLYYPDSPEDDVLAAIVTKIEQMRDDRVSTPDILGIVGGTGEIEQRLVALDPEAADVASRKADLVKHFEDRTAEFVRTVQPLVAPTGDGAKELDRLLEVLNTAERLGGDDLTLEPAVLAAIGSKAVTDTGTGILRIEVPVQFRGPAVRPVYHAATFSRSVAVQHTPDEVDYITPVHPLVTAIATEARRRLLHAFASDRATLPRRLAVQPSAPGSPPAIVFTFLSSVSGGGGLLEEQVLAIKAAPDGSTEVLPDGVASLHESASQGEVQTQEIEQLFDACFDELFVRASTEAARVVAARADALRARRAEQAALLRRDLETDLVDRLREIDEEEARARGLAEQDGQRRLFGADDSRTGGFEARRAAARSQAAIRLEDIAEFESVQAPGQPRPLGALLLVPEGVQ